MAKACAIRKIQKIGNRVFIEFAYGPPPLPPGSTGEYAYQDENALKDSISNIENALGDEGLMLLHLAITYLQPNGTFGSTTAVLNKTLTLDPFAAQPVKIT